MPQTWQRILVPVDFKPRKIQTGTQSPTVTMLRIRWRTFEIPSFAWRVCWPQVWQ